MFMLDNIESYGVQLINSENFLKLLIKFAIHFTITSIICLIYYRKNKEKNENYLFTLFLISTVVFLLCFLLESVNIELGFAVGLFAIFGILRYRTSMIPIKEMTYMFVVIGVGVINAFSNNRISYVELLFTDLMIVLITYSLEKLFFKNHAIKIIRYEKIELIKPDKRKEMLKDLKERTGLDIKKVEIGKIDFLTDTVRLRIYYTIDFSDNNLDI